MLQIGDKHVLSITAVNGVWLHYEISAIFGDVVKPSDLEKFMIDKLLADRLKFTKGK